MICQAHMPGCWGRATQTHHKKPRARGGSDAPANTIRVCVSCHAWIHANPRAATSLGLLIPSWKDEG